jgi:nitrous oxidase accessory protein NosD
MLLRNAVLVLGFAAVSMGGLQQATHAAPNPESVASLCSAIPGMHMNMSDPVDREAFRACRDSLFDAGVIGPPVPEPESAACPMATSDVIVSDIAALRAAVADPANAGKTIAIQGQLDINADFGSDVIMPVDGITLTCASDDAGLTGVPGTSLLTILGSDVTVEHLRLVSGIKGDGRNFGIASLGDNNLIRHNDIECRPFFEDDFSVGILIEEGLTNEARHNTVTGGNIGVVAFLSDSVTIADNTVSDCLTCILAQASTSPDMLRNVVQFSSGNGLWVLDSEFAEVTGNHVSDAYYGMTVSGSTDVTVDENVVERCVERCLEVGLRGSSTSSEQVLVAGNELLECAGPKAFFSAECLRVDQSSNVEVRDNRMQNTPGQLGSLGSAIQVFSGATIDIRNNDVEAGGLLAFNVANGFTITGNNFDNCGDSFFACFDVSDLADTEIVGNLLVQTTDAPFGAAIAASYREALILEGNTIRGNFLDGIIAQNFGFGFPAPAPGSVRILRNDIEIDGGFNGNGIRASSNLNADDGFIEQNRIQLFGQTPAEASERAGIVLTGEVFEVRIIVDGEIVDEFGTFAPLRDYVVANNVVGGGRTGLVVDSVCSSSFIGNALQGNITTAVFGLASQDTPPDAIVVLGGTGANRFVGNGRLIDESTQFGLPVAGDGYIDCDGDGVSDPNVYTGVPRVGQGGFGQTLGEIAARQRELTGAALP